MKINGKDLSSFFATLQEHKIGSANITINQEWLGNKRHFFGYEVKGKKIELDICIDHSSTEMYVSRLMAEFTKEVIIEFDSNDSQYLCTLVSSSKENDELFWEMSFLKIELEGVELKKKVEIEMNRISNQIITVDSTHTVPCVIYIMPSVDMIDLKISGASRNKVTNELEDITLKNLKKGKQIIIDGINKTILEDGENKFHECEMWFFPSLAVGNNEITFSKNTCDIRIEYNPIFI
ncbi:MAG: hypothetical protein KHY88_00225 [Erysipelotrichaceae bacterium]|nr:hypothetical protein [Erysipelotrichaceae bacterium]